MLKQKIDDLQEGIEDELNKSARAILSAPVCNLGDTVVQSLNCIREIVARRVYEIEKSIPDDHTDFGFLLLIFGGCFWLFVLGGVLGTLLGLSLALG